MTRRRGEWETRGDDLEPVCLRFSSFSVSPSLRVIGMLTKSGILKYRVLHELFYPLPGAGINDDEPETVNITALNILDVDDLRTQCKLTRPSR